MRAHFCRLPAGPGFLLSFFKISISDLILIPVFMVLSRYFHRLKSRKTGCLEGRTKLERTAYGRTKCPVDAFKAVFSTLLFEQPCRYLPERLLLPENLMRDFSCGRCLSVPVPGESWGERAALSEFVQHRRAPAVFLPRWLQTAVLGFREARGLLSYLCGC